MFSIKEPILLMFDLIEDDDHQERILFYQENTEFIFKLGVDKQYYFTYHYIRSLFEVAKYELVLSEIDPVIEYVFLDEVNYLSTKTYQRLLYKKAYSLYQMLKFEEAIKIGEALVGIDPEDLGYKKFLEQTYRAFYNYKSAGIRLTALILIFCSAIVSAIIWFINTRGEDTSLAEAFLVIISPCLLALGLFGGAHLFNYLKSIRNAELWVLQKRKKKDQRN